MYQQYPVRSYSWRISNILVYGLIAERGHILLVGRRSKMVENGKSGRTPFLVVYEAGASSTSSFLLPCAASPPVVGVLSLYHMVPPSEG